MRKIFIGTLNKIHFYFIFYCLLLLPLGAFSQEIDTTIVIQLDSNSAAPLSPKVLLSKQARLVMENKFLNSQEAARPYDYILRTQPAKHNSYIYIVFGLMFLYALFFYFFRKYVSAVFRLYMNTSINKTQITDQLRQDELPSLLANGIFVIGLALFATQFIYNSTGREPEKIKYLIFLSVLLAIIYIVKYFCLRFTGWISGFSSQAGLYIFIVFIVNKVLGFMILPLAVMIALGNNAIRQPLLILGIIIIFALLLTRFVKAFNIVRAGAQLQVFHFIIFIFAIEVLPLMLLYKAGKIYLTNLS